MPKNIHNELFSKIIDRENIYKAYKKSLKSDGKYNCEAMEFALNETENINKLMQSLVDETYEFDGYIRFPVFEPKERIVDAPHFKDKVVQLAINNVLKEVYNPSFIFDSYACIDGKGTHKCVDRISHFIRKAKWEYGEDAYIIKLDIKKFFYSIDRDILKSILPKKIRCKKTIDLIFKIIDSAELISPLGLPLGNTLSQICANIYMNELDQYYKRKLSLKYAVRYMDDMIIIVKNKDIARDVFKKINAFVEDELHLQLNKNKSKIFPINQGVNAVGYKIYATHRLLRNDSKKKIKRKIKAMPALISEGKLTVKKAEQMLDSWLGHASHANSYNFIQKLLEKHSFLYLTDKNVLKINTNNLEVDSNDN